MALVDPGSVTPALEALRMAKKLNAHSKTARIALEPWLGCWPRCSVNFRFSQNCSSIAPTPDQSSILRSAKSYPISKPKLSDAQIVPRLRAVTQALDRRTYARLVEPLPPTGQGGRISIAALSLSSNSLPSASCCESYAILDEVPGRTLSAIGFALPGPLRSSPSSTSWRLSNALGQLL